MTSHPLYLRQGQHRLLPGSIPAPGGHKGAVPLLRIEIEPLTLPDRKRAPFQIDFVYKASLWLDELAGNDQTKPPVI